MVEKARLLSIKKIQMGSETEADSPCVYLRTIPESVLDDLCSRFLINIPDEERRDVVRLCFQIETAHWFYIDFYRQEQPELPACGLKEFTRIIFNQFPFLNKTGEDISEIFDNWKKYKLSVPVYGAIIINETYDKCLLVQPYVSRASWGFPKGKVNKDEEEFDCAVREVNEETGFDITPYASPSDFLESSIHDHQIRLYVVPGVPENTRFQPQTRGEIKSIQWFTVDYLPINKKDTGCKDNLGLNPSAFFMVYPFVKGLRRWIATRTRSKIQNGSTDSQEDNSLPVKQQLQKLLEKEDARLEAEQRKAAIEKRRKQQQEKFQLQHELNHPLRQHHHNHKQQLKAARGYQASNPERENIRSSPVQHEQQVTPVKILQRADRVDTSPRDQQTTPSPLQRLFSGKLDTIHSQTADTHVHVPFSPIQRAPPISSSGSPAQPGVVYSSHVFDQWGPCSPHVKYGVEGEEIVDPITKLRLLSSKSSERYSQHNAKVSEPADRTASRFLFTASAFTNFRFDRDAILVSLP